MDSSQEKLGKGLIVAGTLLTAIAVTMEVNDRLETPAWVTAHDAHMEAGRAAHAIRIETLHADANTRKKIMNAQLEAWRGEAALRTLHAPGRGEDQ